MAHDAVNRWTDNIELLRGWCKKRFEGMEQQLQELFEQVCPQPLHAVYMGMGLHACCRAGKIHANHPAWPAEACSLTSQLLQQGAGDLEYLE